MRREFGLQRSYIYDPLTFVEDRSTLGKLDSLAYLYQYTEWAGLPATHIFTTLADLTARLSSLSAASTVQSEPRCATPLRPNAQPWSRGAPAPLGTCSARPPVMPRAGLRQDKEVRMR